MIDIEKRKRLLLALLGAERLYLVFAKTSYFALKVPREFIDALWKTVLDGQLPQTTILKHVQKFLRSKAIPEEENCSGIDFYGLNFISALQCLCDFIETGDDGLLTYVAEELEVNLLDQFLYEEYFPKKVGITDPAKEHQIEADRRMRRLKEQIQIDSALVASSNLDDELVVRMRTASIFDLLT